MKKLHVDRPENIDDHKEIDLLQRLAISWETAPEQLEEVTTEVDVWLRDRADDAVSSSFLHVRLLLVAYVWNSMIVVHCVEESKGSVDEESRVAAV